jgi:hypothetical protein
MLPCSLERGRSETHTVDGALGSREVRARLPSPAHLAVEAAYERFGAVSATGEDLDPRGFVALHCGRGKVADLAGWLLENGAERVSVAALEQAFSARNALYEALEQRIGPGQGCEGARSGPATLDADRAPA